MALEYYVVDVETNGLKAGFHEISEVSIIRCSDRLQITRRVAIEYPERCQAEALAITGKTANDLLLGLSKKEAVEQLENFINLDKLTNASRVMIGHNVSFDRRHLHALYTSVNCFFSADNWIDTIPMVKDWFAKSPISKNATDKPKFNLRASVDMTGTKTLNGQHNAGDDTRQTYLLYNKLIELGVDPLRHVKRVPHEEVVADDFG